MQPDVSALHISHRFVKMRVCFVLQPVAVGKVAELLSVKLRVLARRQDGDPHFATASLFPRLRLDEQPNWKERQDKLPANGRSNRMEAPLPIAWSTKSNGES